MVRGLQVKYVEIESAGHVEARKRLTGTFATECKNIVKRRKSQKIDNYILVTNVAATASVRQRLDVLAQNHLPGKNFHLVDGKEICQFLSIYPAIRQSYPQLLGLADLNRMINKELYVRSEAFMHEWQPRLSTFVRTSIYDDAVDKLRRQHFVVLDGPPEAGKSTIAAAVSLVCVSNGMELINLAQAEDFYKGYEADRSQVFIADDVVGSIKFDPSLAESWSRNLVGILSKLDKQHLLVWTSRKYVLEEALSDTRLGETVKDFPKVHEVVVEVGELSMLEKAQILYNHAKAARLANTTRFAIRKNARRIASNRDFTPERIRQLFEYVLEEDCHAIDDREILDFTERFLKDPGKRWDQAYKSLSPSEQALLVSMLDFRASAPVPALRKAYRERLCAKGAQGLRFEDALARLLHSFLRKGHSHSDGEEYVNYQHPSLRDLLVGELREDEVARRRYIEIASPFGIASMCIGLAESQSEGDEEDHVLWPRTDEEVDSLIRRLGTVTGGALSVQEWEAILAAADRLTPTRRIGRWGRTGQVLLSGDELMAFCGSAQGRILAAVLDAFGQPVVFSNNTRYEGKEWLVLLEYYYESASFVVPFPRPGYLVELVQSFKAIQSEANILELIAVVGKHEPTMTRQLFAQNDVDRIVNHIREEIAALCREGEDYNSESYHDASWHPTEDQYEDWKTSAQRIIERAGQLESLFKSDVDEDVEELEKVLKESASPPEPDDDEDDWRVDIDESEWTIERIFEDL